MSAENAQRDSYLEVLRLPHALRLIGSALLGRLSYATVGLSLLLSVQAASGSFAVAGAATGAFGIVNVLCSPARARAVDRFGPSRALIVMTVVFAAVLVTTGVACLLGAPDWALVALAAAVGVFAPPIGSTLRVIWSTLAPNQRILTRAYSLDAVSEEVVFTTGPLLVGLLVLVSGPVVALFTTAAVALVGTVLFATAPAVRARPPMSGVRHAAQGPLRQRGFAIVLVALAGIGIVLGTVETAVPAFATEHASAAVAGILLAVMSAGSGVAGLLYGRRAWGSSLATRLVGLSTALALVSALAAIAPGLLVLGVILLAVGVFLAPSMITGYLLADALTEQSVRTEASTWINTAVNAGAAIGAALAGVLVDRTTTSVAFAVGAGIAVVATLVAGSRIRMLREASSTPVASVTTDVL